MDRLTLSPKHDERNRFLENILCDNKEDLNIQDIRCLRHFAEHVRQNCKRRDGKKVLPATIQQESREQKTTTTDNDDDEIGNWFTSHTSHVIQNISASNDCPPMNQQQLLLSQPYRYCGLALKFYLFINLIF